MSFAQEMKDFIGGYKTTSELKSQKKLRDAQVDYYKNAEMNGLASNVNMDSSVEAHRQGLLGAIKKIVPRINSGMPKVSMAPSTGGAESSKVALSGNDDENTSDENSGNDSMAIPDTSPQVAAARGGMIPTMHAAGGGNTDVLPPDAVVTDSNDKPLPIQQPEPAPANPKREAAIPPDAKVTDSNGQALPVTPVSQPAPAPRGNAAPPPAEDNSSSNSSANPITGLFDAAGHVISKVMQSFTEDSRKQGAISGKGSDIDWNSMNGSATTAEVKAMDQTYDPNNYLANYQKGAARLVTAYQYFMDKGEPDKAVNVAKRIVLYDKMATMASGKIALQQLQDGDVSGATDTISNAYNNHIPDGHQISASVNPNGQVNMTVSKDGKPVQQQTVDSSALWAVSNDLASGKAALQYYASIAGMNAPTGKKGKGGSGSGGSGGSGSGSVDAYEASLGKVTDSATALDKAQTAYDNETDPDKKAKLKDARDAAKAANAKAVADAKKIGSSVPSKDLTKRHNVGKDVDAANTAREDTADEAVPTTEKPKGFYDTYIAPHMPDLHWGGGAPNGSGQQAPAPAPQQAIPTQGAPAAPAPAQAPAPQQAAPRPQTQTGIAVPPAVMSQAQSAIAKGAPRDAVIQRLRSAGYNVEGL